MTILTVIFLTHISETFGPEHRPIIEFAIENSQKLKLRATREALAKGRQARAAAASKDGVERQGDGPHKKAKKWESKNGEESSVKDTGRSANDSSEAHDADQPGKRKREKRNKTKKADQKTEDVLIDTESGGSAVKGKKPNKKRQKQEEGNPAKQDRNNSKTISSGQTESTKTTPSKAQGDSKSLVKPQVPDQYLHNHSADIGLFRLSVL